MSVFTATHETLLRFPRRRAKRRALDQNLLDGLSADLRAAQAREETLRQQLSLREDMLREFEHRLMNGLQTISCLLTLQSQLAAPEACAQLMIAARRVNALGRVHRRLHHLDHQNAVALKPFLELLCQDLTGLLFQEETSRTIAVEAAEELLPTTLGIPLGFIVNELITNSAKYADGKIDVRFVTTSPAHHALSVSDDGPGLPVGFDPARSKGLGMKIIRSLVQQIDGTLHILPGDNGRGTCFMVTFCSSGSATD
jgi:two-component sensor histidine kinase